jgi:sugar O-acyltransferase (sialic acid O-acetyltransferase NeuD family)
MTKKIKLLGYGAGGHASVIIDIISSQKKFKIVGLIDKKISKKKLLGIPVIGDDNNLFHLKKKTNKIFLGVSDILNPKKNYEIFLNLKKIGFEIISIIDQSCLISKNVKYGEGFKAFPGSIVNVNCKIGKNVLLNTGCIIEHDCILEDNVQVGPGAYIGGNVLIKKNSFIGLGSRVNNNITIEENCIVGSGSVVVSNIKKNQKFAGIPAKKI